MKKNIQNKSNHIIHNNKNYVVIRKNNNNITYENNKIDYNTCDFEWTPLYSALNNGEEEQAIKLIKEGCCINYPKNSFINTPIGLALLLRLFNIVNILLSKDVYVNYNDNEIVNKFIKEFDNIHYYDFLNNYLIHADKLNDQIITLCLKSYSLINTQLFMNILYDYYPIIDNNFIKKFINEKNYNVLEHFNDKFKFNYNDETLINFITDKQYKQEINNVFKTLIKTGFKVNKDKNSNNLSNKSLLYHIINNSSNDSLFDIVEYLINNDIYIDNHLYTDIISYELDSYIYKSLNYNNKMEEINNFFNVEVNIYCPPDALVSVYNYYYVEDMTIMYNKLKKEYEHDKITQINYPKSGLVLYGVDPLIDAIRYKNKKIAKLLIDKNIKINRCYYSAVYFAIAYEYDDILDELIKKKADISGDLDEIKYSYIFNTLYTSQYKYTLKLLQNGAKYDYTFDKFEDSLLFYALLFNKYNITNEFMEVIKFLFKNDKQYNIEMINEFYKYNNNITKIDFNTIN